MTKTIDDYSEDNLVEQIQDDLDAYFCRSGLIGYSTKTSGTRQGFEDLDQFCGDLISAYKDFGALILEVKVRKPGSDFGFLPRYKEDQHAGLKILEEANVPVYFSYDEGALFREHDIDHNLSQIRSPLPSELDIAVADSGGRLGKPLTTGRLNSVRGSTLLEVIENRTHSGATNVYAALQFAFDPHRVRIRSGINSLTTKILLMVYSDAMQRSIILDERTARMVFKEMAARRGAVADYKGGPEFFGAVDKIDAEISDLFSNFHDQEVENENGNTVRSSTTLGM